MEGISEKTEEEEMVVGKLSLADQLSFRPQPGKNGLDSSSPPLLSQTDRRRRRHQDDRGPEFFSLSDQLFCLSALISLTMLPPLPPQTGEEAPQKEEEEN